MDILFLFSFRLDVSVWRSFWMAAAQWKSVISID